MIHGILNIDIIIYDDVTKDNFEEYNDRVKFVAKHDVFVTVFCYSSEFIFYCNEFYTFD